MAARVMKPTAKTKIPVKASGSLSAPKKRAEKVAITTKIKQVPMKPKTTVVKLKKSPEPKNTRISITNNTQKVKSPVAAIKAKSAPPSKVAKKASSVISTAVFPKPAIRSPFRFPVLAENRLPIVARIAGFAFIFTGAFFSLLNAPGSSDAMLSLMGKSNVAAITEPVSTTTTQNIAPITNLVENTPAPTISIEGNSPLSGTVPITVSVPNATSVKLILDNRNSNQLITLGTATKVDANTWRFYWRTEQYSDAPYRIKAIIVNQFTTYDYAGLDIYQVQNSIPEVPVTDDGATISTNQDADISVELFTSKEGTISDELQFKVIAANATRITVHARNTKTGALYYIGQMANSSDTEWRLDWSSKLIPDGKYAFFVRATVGGDIYESSHATLTIANNTVEEVPVVATTTEDETLDDEQLTPTISLTLAEDSPVSKFVHLTLTTSPVMWVELYSTPKNSLATRFLGLATKRSETNWTYEWDTTQIPNGTYFLHSRVKTAFGFTEGSRVEVRVLNQVMEVFTPEQEEVIDGLQDVASDLLTTTEGTENVIDSSTIYVEPVDAFMTTIDTDDDSRSHISDILHTYRTTLETLLDALARAERAADVDGVQKAKEDIETLKSELINGLPGSVQKKELIDQINTYLSQITFELQEFTVRNENILKERVGDAITNDSDKDGITDYDEVNLYKTNPFAADTDGDGFIDSAEITRGYNPHNSAPEALVAYQSPRETGIVREDLLTIETLTTLTPDTIEEQPRAFISGTGLPNSFVTLYIYSTPIMVTVKTRSDGSWNYIFDKELENGDHEVYAVIVDNAGGVVAKSNPLPFVKTAEAFTKADAMSAAFEAQNAEPSLVSKSGILFVASLIIVSLGLVLLLIGAITRSKKVSVELAPIQ